MNGRARDSTWAAGPSASASVGQASTCCPATNWTRSRPRRSTKGGRRGREENRRTVVADKAKKGPWPRRSERLDYAATNGATARRRSDGAPMDDRPGDVRPPTSPSLRERFRPLPLQRPSRQRVLWVVAGVVSPLSSRRPSVTLPPRAGPSPPPPAHTPPAASH